jgi:4-amino-4-deoxy-L-arabinose transferase-like glycosyltransferase
LLSEGLLPYRDFGYSYPPLFLYSLLPFYLLGGQNYASLPIWLFDAATSVPIYYLLKGNGGRIAIAAALGYALCPFALFNEGYLWLSSQPLTFFLLLAFWLLKSGKTTSATAAFAVSALYKQQALALLPLFMILHYRSPGRRLGLNSLVFVAIIVATLAPFIIAAPGPLFNALSFGFFGSPSTTYQPLAPPQSSSASTPCTLVSVNAQFPSVAACGGLTPNLTLFQQQLASLRFFTTLGAIGTFLAPILLLVLLPALLYSRRNKSIVPLAGAYSNAAFLMLFSNLVHASLAYYFLPSFAFLFAASENRLALIVAALAPFLSLTLPEGGIQTVIVLMAILLVTALTEVRDSGTTIGRETPGVEQETESG